MALMEAMSNVLMYSIEAVIVDLAGIELVEELISVLVGL